MSAFRPITMRQEKFLLLLVEGMDQTQAYSRAYPKCSSKQAAATNASRMLKKDHVLRRLEDLRNRQLAVQNARRSVGMQEISEMLDKAYTIAVETRQASAAAQAAMGLAKLHGFLIDRAQIDTVIRRPSARPDDPDEMTESAWVERYGIPVIEHNSEPVEMVIDDNNSESEPDTVMAHNSIEAEEE